MERQSRHGRVTKLAGVTELALARDRERPLSPLTPLLSKLFAVENISTN